ncbi:MAG: GrpB family protein [Longibaculum sp.]
MLVFRDWLINHPEDRELYAQTKRSLVRRFGVMKDYADQKRLCTSDYDVF